MSTVEQTYTILETKLKESVDEQVDLQSLNINDVMEQSQIIRELSDMLNEGIDDEPLTYSNS